MKKNFNKSILHHIRSLSIRKKIIWFYMILIIVSILLSMFIYNSTNAYYLNKRIKELTIAEIEADNRTLETLVDDINNYSKILIGSQNLQMVLKEDSGEIKNYKVLDRELAEFNNFNYKVSSIYIFKNDGTKYYTEKAKLKDIHLEDIQRLPWYTELVEKRGGYLLNMNGNGLLVNLKDDYLTFFRIINSLESQKPIGIMMINVKADVIQEILGLDQQINNMFVLDIDHTSEPNTLVFNGIDGIFQSEYLSALQQELHLWESEKLGKTQMLITGINNEVYGWKLLRVTPLKGRFTQMNIFNIAIFAIILLNGILVFMGSFVISRYFTNPISQLTDSMKEVQKGCFYPVEVETNNDEIGLLKDGYNFMIQEIQNLIQEIIDEQKILKKAEFSVLMEQIKPHFLYNTLDSISSLVMLGRNDEAYQSLRALGSFYRTSLSDGRNMITVENEVQIIRNYLYIQKIRYGELFNVTYEVDPEVLQFKVPRLILQPLVENSIYHGIRPLGEKGLIEIAIDKENTNMVLIVKDNGVGMSAEKMALLNDNSDNSVGIPATRDRIRSIYGNKSEFSIQNNVDGGICITIKIPWEVEIFDEKKYAKSSHRR